MSDRQLEFIFEVFKHPLFWILGVCIVAFGTWLRGFFSQFLPPPRRARLAILNYFQTMVPHSDERFRFVLCWLKGDDGGHTDIVAEAFRDIKGVELVCSAELVASTGAADTWEPKMREHAIRVLKIWNADLAIIGSVTKSRKQALSLWFVPRLSNGTLHRGNIVYRLQEDGILESEFYEELCARLAAEALAVAAPATKNKLRGQVLTNDLYFIAEKIKKLISGKAITDCKRLARLHIALGKVLMSLGEWERGPERFEQAIVAFNAAMEEFTRERAPIQWAQTQRDLGGALESLGDRRNSTEHLEQAVAAYKKALEELTQKRMPREWARTRTMLGGVLIDLGNRQKSIDCIKQALAVYNTALEEFTREQAPVDWAILQQNIGIGLIRLATLERSVEPLQQAVATHHAALEELTRERAPLYWARTQNSLGVALLNLGEEESEEGYLKQAVAAHHAALEEFTHERAPVDWAITQRNLGEALLKLGERKNDSMYIEQAVSAFSASLKEFTRERSLGEWAMTQAYLGEALLGLGERQNSMELLEQAVALLEQAATALDTEPKADMPNQSETG